MCIFMSRYHFVVYIGFWVLFTHKNALLYIFFTYILCVMMGDDGWQKVKPKHGGAEAIIMSMVQTYLCTKNKDLYK